MLTTHTDRAGNPKLKQTCALPLSASACVTRIFTDLAVIDVTPDGFALTELAEGTRVDDVQRATDAPFRFPTRQFRLSEPPHDRRPQDPPLRRR